MYENVTYQIILDRMIDKAKETSPMMDYRAGSVMWNTLSAVAMEIMNMFVEINQVYKQTFATDSDREFLIKRAKERGLSPQPSTKAILKAVFTPSTLNVPIGSRFSMDKLNYVVTEKIADGEYEITCETAGSVGNITFGLLVPIEYIYGLERAEATEVLILGEDEEDTETFRKRYFQSLSAEAYGGNKADYHDKVSLMNGVGGVKIYTGSEWNGGGTVKIVITDSDFGKPTTTLISTIQEEIDPLNEQGTGVGIAPIGHYVTVAGVSEEIVNITTSLIYKAGYTWDNVKPSVGLAIDEYFKDLNSNWENEKAIVVRKSQLEARLLNVEGIIDIADTQLNGQTDNWTCNKDSIVIRGEVNATD